MRGIDKKHGAVEEQNWNRNHSCGYDVKHGQGSHSCGYDLKHGQSRNSRHMYIIFFLDACTFLFP
jgi:hypothetical protein